MPVIENLKHSEHQYKGLLGSQNEELRQLLNTDGPGSSTVKKLEADRASAARELQLCKNTLGGRSVQILLNTVWVSWVATAIVLITEAFVNKVLFDMALLSSSITSVAASALISVFLLFFAHQSGRFMRQIYSDFHGKISWSSLLLGLICGAIVLFAILGVMYTRAFFDAQNVVEGGLEIFGEVAQRAYSDGFSQIISEAFSTSESTVMGAVNFGALFGAFMIAVLSHDPCYEYDQRYRDFDKLDKKIEKQHKRYEQAIKRIHNKYAVPLSKAKSVFANSGGNPEHLPEGSITLNLEKIIAEDTNNIESDDKTKTIEGRIKWLDIQ